MNAERQTVYRWSFIWSGALVALIGAVLLGVAITRSDAWARVAGTSSDEIGESQQQPKSPNPEGGEHR